ncbi:sodium-dependent bicarbonate transport family permease [Shewanella psychrotolerans]|uniref:sodium-dependent bicarbonate transport family permease n=1 Tax=Shewanella psychrotolerans TaxID=2864206 RepID=UPI001C659FBB|nr:sodium-dependent bicarbonate transport family permease [Shewanella psychrotolerans]QYK02402.1 sodium-dependent bicarbonate transport family permease [Shewanella psychrotolerans]
MQMDITIAFFILGAFATLVKANMQFPKALYQSLTLFLLIAIGLKGGVALAEYGAPKLLPQSAFVILLGLVIPLIAFPILRFIGQLNREDSASIAAHYGSVSIGTYAVAVAFLESQNIAYEAYFPLFVVLLEVPAIAMGIGLAKKTGDKVKWRVLLHEVFCNQSMVLLVGALLIGYWGADQIGSVKPLFIDLFRGVLALFLLEMGMVAASRIKDLKQMGNFMLAFGVAMPLIGGLLGCLLGIQMGLSSGGATLLAVLGGSASYIAVPAAMRVAIPNANHSLSITYSLAITFPFNVLVGIPTYALFTYWLTN